MVGDLRRAAVLMGAEFALREKIDIALPASAAAAYKRDDATLRAALNDAEYEACRMQGRDMSEAEVYNYAWQGRT